MVSIGDSTSDGLQDVRYFWFKHIVERHPALGSSGVVPSPRLTTSVSLPLLITVSSNLYSLTKALIQTGHRVSW